MPKRSLPCPPQETIAAADLASYIADMSGELALLAGRARWPLLTYFLNMARIEAETRMAVETPTVAPARSQRSGRARKRAVSRA